MKRIIGIIYLTLIINALQGQESNYIVKGKYLLNVKDSNFIIEAYWGEIKDISTILIKSKKDKSMIMMDANKIYDVNSVNFFNQQLANNKAKMTYEIKEIKTEKNYDYIIYKAMIYDEKQKPDSVCMAILNLKKEGQTFSFLIYIEENTTIDNQYLLLKKQINDWTNSIQLIKDTTVLKQFEYSNKINYNKVLNSIDTTFEFRNNGITKEIEKKDTIETYFYNHVFSIKSKGNYNPYAIFLKNNNMSLVSNFEQFKNKYYTNVILQNKINFLQSNEIIYYDSLRNKKIVENINLNQVVIRKNWDTSFQIFKLFTSKKLDSNIENNIPLYLYNYDPELFEFKIEKNQGTCEYNSRLKTLTIVPNEGVTVIKLTVLYFRKAVYGTSFNVK